MTSGPMSQRRVVAAWAGFGVAAVVSAALIWLRPPAQRLSDLHIYYGAARAVNDGDATLLPLRSALAG